MKKSALLGLLLVGCNAGDSGIWILELPYTDATECEDVLTHNFTNGYVEEEETDDAVWIVEESETLSPRLLTVQVEDYGDGNALLLIGNVMYPGVAGTNGWVFSWTGSTDSNSTQTHEAGYTYTTNNVATSEEKITLVVSGDTATGSWSSNANSDRSWSESDTWDGPGVGSFTGSIPSSQYLVHDYYEKKTLIEGAPLSNSFEEADCSGDCELQITSSCAGSTDFSANRADFEDESVYEYLDVAGQPYGS